MRTFFSKHSDFLSNVAVLMSGKTLAAAISLATVPIVARLFSPEDFGVAAVFASTIGILSTVASLRYGAAIVLPKDESTAVDLLGFSQRVVIGFCTLIFLVILITDLASISWPALDILGAWKWILPFGVWLTAVASLHDAWLTRVKNFRNISASLLAGNLTTSGIRIGLGTLQGTSVSGLIFGDLVGKIAKLIVQRKTCKLSLSSTFESDSWSISKALAKRYADFPKFNAPAGFIFSLGQNLPVLLFGALFGPAVAGFYAMANRVSHAPVSIVATSMRRVFLQKAAEITHRNASLTKAFSLSVISLAILGIVPFTLIYAFGQQLLVWLLGETWLEAGSFLEIIAPWLLSIWITVPCNPVFVVLRKQKFWLVLTSTLTALRLSAFTLAYAMNSDPLRTLEYYVVATIVGNLVTISTAFVLIRSARNNLKT